MNDFSFHEASVLEIFVENGDCLLRLDDVACDQGKLQVLVAVRGLEKVFIDSIQADYTKLKMIAPDGEILSLELENDALFILIEWNNFPLRSSITHSYRIEGEEVEIQVC